MKEKVLLLIDKRMLRLEIKNKLEEKVDVFGGTSLEDLIPEIKWTDVAAVVIDLADEAIDGYGMLEVLNTTHPSIPVVCLVDNPEDAEEYSAQSANNHILENISEPGAVADQVLNLIKNPENDVTAPKSNNARAAFATQLQRLQGNLRRIDDYAWGEVTQTVKSENIPWGEVEWLEEFNIGLEGFLQIQMEGRNSK